MLLYSKLLYLSLTYGVVLVTVDLSNLPKNQLVVSLWYTLVVVFT